MSNIPKFSETINKYRVSIEGNRDKTYSKDQFANSCAAVLRTTNISEFLKLNHEDYSYLTVNITGTIFNSRGMTKNGLTAKNLLITKTIWDTLYPTKALRGRILRESRKNPILKFRLIPLIIEGIIEEDIPYDLTISEDQVLDKKSTLNHLANGAPVTTDTSIIETRESVGLDYIIKSKYIKLGLAKLLGSNKQNFFNGMITKYTYTFDNDTNVYQFAYYAIKFFEEIIVKEINENKYVGRNEVPYLAVVVRYDIVDSKGEIREIQRKAVCKGIGFNGAGSIFLLQNNKKLPSDLEQVKNNLQKSIKTAIVEYDENVYDRTTVDVAGKYLDTTWLQIQKIDIVRSGGGSDGDSVKFFEFLKREIKSHCYTSGKLSWCKIVNYSSTNNNCFFRILLETFKDYFKKELQISRVDNLRKYCFPEITGNLNSTIEIEKACEICDKFGIKIYIYETDGSVLIESQSQDEGFNRLDVVYGYHHYVKIVRMSTSRPIITKKITEETNTETFTRDELRKEFYQSFNRKIKINVYYDFETVNDADRPGYDRQVHCYSVSWKFGISDDDKKLIFDYMENYNLLKLTHKNTYYTCGINNLFINRKYNIDEVKYLLSQEYHYQTCKPSDDTVISQLIASVMKLIKLLDLPTNVDIVMIAYNGAGFDHFKLHNYLICKRFQAVSPPVLHGKLKFMVFMLYEISKLVTHCEEYYMFSNYQGQYWNEMMKKCDKEYYATHLNFHVNLMIWDPCLFLHCSLQAAADCFGIEMKKGSYDHEYVQKMYEDGKFEEFVNENSKLIETYNNQDVRILECIVDKFSNACKLITEDNGFDVRTFGTVAQMSYKLWGDVKVSEEKRMRHFVKRVESYELDCFIRRGIVGGRVQGIYGYQVGDFDFLDFVSMYPANMVNNEYPVGDEVEIDNDPKLCEEVCYHRDLIGIFECTVDQKGCTGRNYVLPYKEKGKNLNWKFGGVMTCVITDYDVKLLRKYGCKVEFCGKGVYWQRSEAGFVFGEIIEKLSKVKKREDELKLKKSSDYNPVLRAYSKMLMNSLSGKMSQRVFKDEVKYWNCDNLKKMRKYLEDHPGACIHDLNDDILYTEGEKSKFYNGSCKPSQIGVFIYSYSRGSIYESFYSKYDVYYGDTDSALINRDSYFDLLKTGCVWNGIGEKKFGMIENEEGEYGKIVDFFVVSPKCYCVFYESGKVKCKIKGVKNSDVFECDGGKLLKISGNERILFTLLMNRDVVVFTSFFKKKISEKSFSYCKLAKVIERMKI